MFNCLLNTTDQNLHHKPIYSHFISLRKGRLLGSDIRTADIDCCWQWIRLKFFLFWSQTKFAMKPNTGFFCDNHEFAVLKSLIYLITYCQIWGASCLRPLAHFYLKLAIFLNILIFDNRMTFGIVKMSHQVWIITTLVNSLQREREILISTQI